jgi:hypothetical protein
VPEFDERFGLGLRCHFQQLSREAHQRHLGVGMLVIDDDVLIMQTELAPQQTGRLAGQFLLQQFPQLPLAQSVAQEDEHHLSGNHIEGAGVKVTYYLVIGIDYIILA